MISAGTMTWFGGQSTRAVSDSAAPAVSASAAEDAALVERAGRGDPAAFGALASRHLDAAHAAALAVTLDRHDAEDVVQEAFLRALDRLESCRPAEKFRPWLLTIVRNQAFDLRRRRRVRAAEPLEAAESRSSHAREPLLFAERGDLREHLEAALVTLTDLRREVLLLHDLEGWRHGEIAEHLGIAEGTVRAHLFRARRDLRARLSPELRRGNDDD